MWLHLVFFHERGCKMFGRGTGWIPKSITNYHKQHHYSLRLFAVGKGERHRFLSFSHSVGCCCSSRQRHNCNQGSKPTVSASSALLIKCETLLEMKWWCPWHLFPPSKWTFPYRLLRLFLWLQESRGRSPHRLPWTKDFLKWHCLGSNAILVIMAGNLRRLPGLGGIRTCLPWVLYPNPQCLLMTSLFLPIIPLPTKMTACITGTQMLVWKPATRLLNFPNNLDELPWGARLFPHRLLPPKKLLIAWIGRGLYYYVALPWDHSAAKTLPKKIVLPRDVKIPKAPGWARLHVPTPVYTHARVRTMFPAAVVVRDDQRRVVVIPVIPTWPCDEIVARNFHVEPPWAVWKRQRLACRDQFHRPLDGKEEAL